MSTTRNVFDPTTNLTPQERKLNQPVPQSATTASDARPQDTFGNDGVQSGPTLTQQARDGAQMAYDAVASGLSNLMPGSLAPGATSTGQTTERHFRNNMPHVGGVGDLPGSANESSVALLPDERAERDSQFRSNQSPLGLARSNDLAAAQDASRAGAGAPLAGGMMQQQSGAAPFSKQSDMAQGFASGAGAGAGAPFNQNRDQATSIGASYGIGRDIQPGAGATNQGPSALDDNAMQGVTTTSNTMPHHEQATSPASAILEHPSGHHEDDTQRRGGVTGRVEDSVKHAAAGVTGTHRDTGTRHHDDSTAGTVDPTHARHDDNTQRQGGMTGRVEEAVKGTTAKVTGAHHDTEARHDDSSKAGVERSKAPHTSNINTSATATTRHDDHTASSSSPTSPSKMDKLKGAFMMKKGHIFHDEEEVRQGENLKTTGKKFPDVDKK